MIIDSFTIQRATELLLAAAPVGSRVIFFGSLANGRADTRSDLDFLVIEPAVDDLISEMLRLTEILRPLKLPVDLLVLSNQNFERWKGTPYSLAYRASREGTVYGPAV